MIIRIRGSKATAAIDSVGAQLISFQDASHKEYIWDQNPAYWSSSSPVLFPMISNLRPCGTEMEGKMYPLTRHGVVRYAPFAVTAQTEDSVTFCTCSNEDTLQVYPYQFALYVTFTIAEESLHVELKVENTGSNTMYYHIGGHPAFHCPMNEGERFEDYELRFPCEETITSPVYNIQQQMILHDHTAQYLDHSSRLPLDYSLFDSDALIFTGLKSSYVSLVHKETGKGIRFTPEHFETLAFWSPIGKKAPFLCIEPWNGTAIWDTDDDVFSHKKGICTLSAGAASCYGYWIAPEK